MTVSPRPVAGPLHVQTNSFHFSSDIVAKIRSVRHREDTHSRMLGLFLTLSTLISPERHLLIFLFIIYIFSLSIYTADIGQKFRTVVVTKLRIF